MKLSILVIDKNVKTTVVSEQNIFREQNSENKMNNPQMIIMYNRYYYVYYFVTSKEILIIEVNLLLLFVRSIILHSMDQHLSTYFFSSTKSP